ncbi:MULTISPECIES: hypothetical protein [unclassified Amycolatopsis]|uniref:hypothetical protein n=1 Tax=unclassified Amycolatopsis TaxID=2618356 RepID=UPI002874DB51|nr:MULTISPECIES: hypothetical protein [unclassified Amycolatopsis]MDS0133404.1 hypothetical protein [Amycolatopsis sp. 505]MDS0146634.1 hypothetical protein [Amycolatopsis sp. CM201R]
MGGSQFGAPGSFTPPPAAGDAGTNFLSGLLEGPADSEAAQRVSEGGHHLKSLAEGGQFAVNEEGFQAYMKACDFFLDGYNSMIREVFVLANPARMGGGEYAKAVAEFNVKVANGDEESLIPNLIKMRDGVQQAREAMIIARKNYRETEEAHSMTFAQMNKGLQE